MKATLYLYLDAEKGWRAAVTLDAEVDLRWRLDAEWAAEAAREAGASPPVPAEAMLACGVPLPLGAAYEAAASWNRQGPVPAGAQGGARRLRASRAAAPGGAAPLRLPEAAEALRRLARAALAPDGPEWPSGSRP
ncbi:hypothetical protein HGI30_21160 [Paenibacillus albicereus]|uniref:Uncharacterized protein n=1 Tax=Paenibacillus albicereus TaxID=2726185 RepID=A0A6H2H260_9BACL|nr:hypothetical protein [Paenibacillus albicereus]QJC53784.1 hypothetical protein HGI30_21160 [Paenibacillus albicereus]